MGQASWRLQQLPGDERGEKRKLYFLNQISRKQTGSATVVCSSHMGKGEDVCRWRLSENEAKVRPQKARRLYLHQGAVSNFTPRQTLLGHKYNSH